jgi:hypothetical protein
MNQGGQRTRAAPLALLGGTPHDIAPLLLPRLLAEKSTTVSSNFKFDERALNKVMQDAAAQVSRQVTAQLDGLRTQYAGRPLPEIKAALQRTMRGNGGSITDPELTQYAELIQANTRITFVPKDAR